MKNIHLFFDLLIILFLKMTSCYSLTYIVGDGAQTGMLMMKKNNYLVNGLSPLKTSNPSNMAGDEKTTK